MQKLGLPDFSQFYGIAQKSHFIHECIMISENE